MTSTRIHRSDLLFFMSLMPFALVSIGFMIMVFIVISTQSTQSIEEFGLDLFTRSVWNPEIELYGIFSPVIGTFIVSLISVLFSLVFSIPLVILISEYLRGWVRDLLSSTVELMGGMPTVIYAVWSIHNLVPVMKTTVLDPLHSYLGFTPFFSCRPVAGFSVLTAGVAVGISLIPYVTSIISESYKLVPSIYREACYGIGASRYETVKTMLSITKPAILASILLGFSRAAGETTIAVTTIGNAINASPCILAPGYTVPALIAAQYANANLYFYAESVLYTSALIVLSVTLVLSFIGLKILEDWRVKIVV